MKKNLIDPHILAMYLGQQFRYRYVDWADGSWSPWGILLGRDIDKMQDLSVDDIQLKVRPFESITEEEKRMVFEIVFRRPFPKNGNIVFMPERTTIQEPRWVLCSGLDRCGIQANAQVWADCDLHPWKHNEHEVTLYFVKQGLDVFNLIKRGQAEKK